MERSNVIYIVINENGTLLTTKNRDFKIYRTLQGLIKQSDQFKGKRVEIYKLDSVKSIDDLTGKY